MHAASSHCCIIFVYIVVLHLFRIKCVRVVYIINAVSALMYSVRHKVCSMRYTRGVYTTPYKRWSKCTMEKVGGRVLQELRGKCINFLYKIKNLLYWHLVRCYDCCHQMSPENFCLRVYTTLTLTCQILRLKCTKFNFGGAQPQTPLGELTALPHTL